MNDIELKKDVQLPFHPLSRMITYLQIGLLLFSFQISAAITSKESEAVSPLLMDVNSSLTMEIFLNIPHHRNHRNRAYFL